MQEDDLFQKIETKKNLFIMSSLSEGENRRYKQVEMEIGQRNGEWTVKSLCVTIRIFN